MKIAPTGKSFEFIGHRGNSGNPLNSKNIENTLPSFKSAFDAGADGIELDVILTKPYIVTSKHLDPVLAVHHDNRFGRVFIIPGENPEKLVSEFDALEIRLNSELNIKGLEADLAKKGSYLSPILQDDLDGNTVFLPTLNEVEIPYGKKLFLELKFLDDKLPEDKIYLKEIAKKAVEYIAANISFDGTYVLSFVPEALAEVKKLNNKIITAHNIYQEEASDLEKIKQLKKDYGFDIMNPPFVQASKQAIENIHSAGLKTYPWVWKENAAEEISEVRRLFLEGADGAITNQVEEALQTTFDYH